ncbi:hypothetical protein Acor_18480 [Acrocarpospora corrugata]|uniref:Fido domain-containing protein n=1 Tax=Acrocarpospora corrugata TaxID=35763 RepID=A0A5M3VSQ6_9ACTN|nr:Fic family protein [Acrocarpospora corrugata]GER99784.1 hypothetical protein Acor_18480 [Acrocarpospora corrugata]
MIVNNFLAMRRIGEIRHERMTPELICDIHRLVTDGTLDTAETAGRIQLPGEQRVVVVDHLGEVLHEPPAAVELPRRLERLCEFANATTDGAYVPPVVRAIVIHFMLAYDHPFADGNGRTARALFYWSMLNQEYWLTEFVSISRLLKKAPSKYARSFLHSEHDEGDLTYFIIYQLEILQRAIKDLIAYLDRKSAETKRFQEALAGRASDFSHRQVAVLQRAIAHPPTHFTVQSHATSHKVAIQTARNDLRDLEGRGLLVRIAQGRGYAWTAPANLADLLSG